MESDENTEENVHALLEVLKNFNLNENMAKAMELLPGHFTEKNICRTLERLQKERGIVIHASVIDSNRGLKVYAKNPFAFEVREKISSIIEDLTEEVNLALELGRNELDTIPKLIVEYMRQKSEILKQFSSHLTDDVPYSDLEIVTVPKKPFLLLIFPCNKCQTCIQNDVTTLCETQEAIFTAFKWILNEISERSYEITVGNTIISIKDSVECSGTERCGLRVPIKEKKGQNRRD